MAAERLQIIIDAVFPGRNTVQQAQRDMAGLDDAAAKTGRGFLEAGKNIATSLAGVGIAVAGAVMATKQLYDTLKEGAALNRSADMFDRLTVSIGSTADVMLGKLRAATSGMVSDAELIAGAGQIISLGLADTEDGVVRLATLVSKLGWDMQQVIMTFANNSVMRLDALGLSVEDVTSKAKALEAQGYSTDKAFDMAVIQAGEEKLRLLGDAAETTSGQLITLEADWANFVNSMKTGLAEAVGPAIAGLAALSKAGSTTSAAIAKMQSETAGVSEQLAALSSGLTEAVNSWLPTTAPVEEIRKAVIDLIKTQVDFTQGIMSAERQLQELNAGFDITSDGAIRLNGVIVGLYPDIRAIGLAWAAATEAAAADAAMLGNWSDTAHSMDLPAVESELRNFTNELERLAIAGRTAAESQQAFDAMLYPDGVDAYNMALARQEKWLAAVAAGYTTAAGAIDAMRAAQVAAQEAQRQALGGEFAGVFDTTGMSEASRIMLETAANAGTAAEQLYVLAGGGQAAGEAMMQAAVNVRAAQLGELLAAGLITAKQAAQDLQDFADNLNLEDMFSADKILPGTTSPESLRDRLLGPAEGLVSAVSDTVTAATEPATNAIDELIKSLDEADQMDPEIIVDDETVTSATGNVTGLFDALVSLTDRDWVVNVVYQTSGTIPGATDSGGYTGGSGTYSPPPTTSNAPGGNAPSRGGNAPASNTTYNFNMPGMTPAGVESRIANAMTRGYARSTR